MSNFERSLVGWQAIADFFQCSVTKIISHKKELHDCGAIFYMRHGRPSARRVHAFPLKLMAWQSGKNERGEFL
jgi:hypothetical protein